MNNPMKVLFTAALFALHVAAFAHIGADDGAHHVTGFVQGFIHPLIGLDHLFAMTLLGVWSSMNTQKWWLAPISFASLLLVGALIGMAGLVVPATEHISAASLLVLGLMVAMQLKLSTATGAVLVGSFALFHGLALGYAMLAAKRSVWWPRVIGAGSALLGVGLLSGFFA